MSDPCRISAVDGDETGGEGGRGVGEEQTPIFHGCGTLKLSRNKTAASGPVRLHSCFLSTASIPELILPLQA